MSLINCGRCEKPFLSSTNLKICSSCLSRETHIFESYYYRIEKLIRECGLDSYLTDAPFDKTRFKEAAHLRLGTGLVLKLEGWHQGNCHVCSARQSHPDSKEPICITCIEIFFNVLASRKMVPSGRRATAQYDVTDPKAQETKSPKANKLVDLANESAANVPELSKVEAMELELARYRQHYGELRSLSCRVVGEEPVSKSTLSPELIEAITHQIFEVLSLADEDVSLAHIDWAALGLSGVDIQGLSDTACLSGFKRLPNVF